jgi:hypothetical protein
MSDFITEIFEPVEIVMEMATDQSRLVPLNADFLSSVIRGDENPLFGTYVIESGWSKSKRFWGPELFGDVASEIASAAVTEPIVGYLGHISPDRDPYDFPEIQLQWVGAKLLQSGDQARLAVKAYFLPGTKAREYAERKLAQTVSWRGKIAQEMFQKGVRIKKFAIESIDLARPRAAGMSARLVALASEMESEEGGNSVKPEEIAALAENELRAHNSGLVATIEANARKPLEEKVGEMETAASAVVPVTAEIPSLKSALGLSENADDVTVLKAAIKFVREQGKSVREALLDKVLKAKKLDGDDKDVKLARRLIVGEMRGDDFTPTGDVEADEKTVTEMVNRIIDSSDDLKEIVSEMEGAPPSVPDAGGRGRGGEGVRREMKPGLTTSNIRVRASR